ncbi:hypothetical protein PENTCL1PPCAC_26356, partial [Pristionchus entomophagus]
MGSLRKGTIAFSVSSIPPSIFLPSSNNPITPAHLNLSHKPEAENTRRMEIVWPESASNPFAISNAVSSWIPLSYCPRILDQRPLSWCVLFSDARLCLMKRGRDGHLKIP